ncbi:hypothetical protein PR048_020888 [Dryococelus australis]|uniref:Uncharacterized protein n=1 Tax=Dryococelus australis TaxID=614101 RepID=A0ABQ9GWR3_9NEOP|nr:hypothetical protein PR048_020888 [Dryococelus australis]
MFVIESLMQLSVLLQQTTTQWYVRVTLSVIKLPTFFGEVKGCLNCCNLFTTLIGALVATADSAQSLRGLLSAIVENVAALKALNLPVDQWDLLLLHLLEKHIDQALRKQWELVVNELDIPALSDFTDFLEKHCSSSKFIVGTSQKYIQFKSINIRKVPEQHRTSSGSFFVNPSRKVLPFNGDHTIHRCSGFVVSRRTNIVDNCNACHNTMLHFPSDKPSTTVTPSVQDEVPVDTHSNENSTLSLLSSFSNDFLCSGCLWKQPACWSCAQLNHAFFQLGVKHQTLSIPFHGFAHTPLTSAKGVTSCIITPSGRKEPYLPIEALILP